MVIHRYAHCLSMLYGYRYVHGLSMPYGYRYIHGLSMLYGYRYVHGLSMLYDWMYVHVSTFNHVYYQPTSVPYLGAVPLYVRERP